MVGRDRKEKVEEAGELEEERGKSEGEKTWREKIRMEMKNRIQGD